MLWHGTRELLRGYGSWLSTVVLGLICAEVGLFIAMFWAMFTIQWGTVLGASSMALQGPQSLVLVVTTDLSILGACMAARTVRMQYGCLSSRMAILSSTILPAGAFCWILISEYRALSLYINDMTQGSALMLITGLHFMHVSVGILFLAFSAPYQGSRVPLAALPNRRNVRSSWRFESGSLGPVLYMHFVELVWIGIHVGAYI